LRDEQKIDTEKLPEINKMLKMIGDKIEQVKGKEQKV